MHKQLLNAVLFGLCFFVFENANCQNEDVFFQSIKNARIESDPSIIWKNFGPGMSGYCEEFWCHPTDTNVMFMGPDMHVSFGTWDNGQSWHTIKDSDGLGQDMKRVLDVEFSLQNPNFGMALDWNGWIYETENRGKSWTRIGGFGKDYTDFGIDPNDPQAFSKGWYYEQKGTRHSELAVDPQNDNVWYVGAGDFWNVKSNHRSLKNIQGVKLGYAAYGAIWKTADRGANWVKITNGIPENTEVGKIIVHPTSPDEIVMATNVGLLHSFDGGNSWKSIAKGLPNNMPRDLTCFFDESTGEYILYLVEQTVFEKSGNSTSAKGGIFISTNGGRDWGDITGDFAFDLNEISFEAEKQRYYKTISYWFGISGEEARTQYPDLPTKTLPVFNRILVNPVNKSEIYVSYNKKHDYTFGPGDVWKTDNLGMHWYACARQGEYWISGKDKEYWRKRNNPTGTNVQFAHLQTYMDNTAATSGNRMMEVNAAGHIFIGIDQQTLKSTDGGESWFQIDDDETSEGSNKWIGRGGSNLPGRYMLHETGIKGRRLLCSGEHGLWQTADLDNWPDKKVVAVEQIEGQVHDHSGYHGAHSISTVAVHPHNPDIIYTLSWRQEHRGKLRRTSDGGKSWENIATIFDSDNNIWQGLAPQNSLTIDPDNPNNMYFCATLRRISEVGGGKSEKLTKGEYGAYHSFDAGYTWEPANSGFPNGFSIRRIVLDPQNSKRIYAAANDANGGLFVSNNQGENWEKVALPKAIKAVNNVFIDRNTNEIYIATGQQSGSYEEGGVWRSGDLGKKWVKIFKAPYVWQVESSPVNSNIIVISVAGQSVRLAEQFMNPGIYYSSDHGKSWTKINKGLGQPDKIVDVKPDPYNENVLWCASWGCGWFIAYLNETEEGWLLNNK